MCLHKMLSFRSCIGLKKANSFGGRKINGTVTMGIFSGKMLAPNEDEYVLFTNQIGKEVGLNSGKVRE